MDMANIQLLNDRIATYPIVGLNWAGASQAIIDVITVTVSNPAQLQATITTDAGSHPSLNLKPLVSLANGVTVTLTDTSKPSIPPYVSTYDIIPDNQPLTISLNTAAVTYAPLP